MKKILVVDDSALSRRIVRSILEPAGFEVVEAKDGIAALERYFLDKPDVVMLDLLMEGLYGLEVLVKLKEMDPDVAVIVATADIQASTSEMALQTGAFTVISKPFASDPVIAAVKAALEARANADR